MIVKILFAYICLFFLVLYIFALTKLFVHTERACGGSVPAILPEDEPEQHDLAPHAPHRHRCHHDRCQLHRLWCRLDNAGNDDDDNDDNRDDSKDVAPDNVIWFQGVTLGVFSIMYLILVILMTRSFLNEVYLIIFSYVVLASFFGIEVCFPIFPSCLVSKRCIKLIDNEVDFSPGSI